jgi:hypothetical protein
MRFVTWFGAFLSMTAVATLASAHHEAIFGPQSSLILSPPGFVSTQAFTKRLGPNGRQETTFVLSGGVTPWKQVPVSFALTVPASVATENGSVHKGMENLVLGMRYRYDFEGLQRSWGKDGNFVMAVGAVEPPTGTMDYKALHGPTNYLGAVITSLECGYFGASFFTLLRREGTDSAGEKRGDELIFGGGLALTPWDNPGRMLSFQLGFSEENHLPARTSAGATAGTGGYEVMLTPAVVGSPHRHLHLFALFSLPVFEGMRDPDERARWRAGAGVTWLLEAEK